MKNLKTTGRPNDIAGYLQESNLPLTVGTNSIYRWLYSSRGVKYCQYLYSKQYHPKPKKEKTNKKDPIPFKTSIHERTEEINERIDVGHYEGDLVVSGKRTRSKDSLRVLVDRKIKLINIRRVKDYKPSSFNESIGQVKEMLGMKSLTLDNGLENRWHYKLGLKTYFCDSYSSWQKGTVENVNKQIRRFIPKGSNISRYSDEYIAWVENILNNKPRKSLGYRTPLECAIAEGLISVADKQKTMT